MIKFSGQTTGGGGGVVPDASETVKGIIRIATSAEATTGTNDLIAMTPKTVADEIGAAVLGLFDYKGALDASQPTTPDISSGLKGDFYRISVAGTIYGKTWALNDALVINADMGGTVDNAKIDKFDNTDAVSSVNTQTGAVVLDSADIAENTNLYYTDGRVDSEVATLPLSTLSDVTYTAGAGIDGKVLSYVHASAEWQAVTPATAPVTSVNTQTGAVVLDTADVSENTNLYYTDGRVDTEVGTLPLTTLSDVAYTAGAGIDGKVLTYVHGSTEWQAVTPTTAPVSSVNTQTGAVVLDTADVAENTNLYYTDGRVDTEVATLPLTTLSDVTYTAGAGIDGKVLTYVHGSTEWQAVTPATAPVTSVNTQTGAVVLDSADIAENTNLYYTDGRVDTEVGTLPLTTLSDVTYTAGAGIDGKVLTYVHGSTEWQAVTPASAPVSSVNTQTGAVVLNTSNIAENTNLYYTDGRVDARAATLPLSTLSDVSYTGGAGIDGKVLTWVNASSEWQAVTASGGGGAGWTYSAITSASSPVTAAVDYHYGANTSVALITFNLPAVSGTTAGEQIRVKLNVAGNNLNVTPNGSDNIDGVGSAYALSIALSSITLVSDGSANWEIV